jgi:signal peptidase I
VSQAQEIIKDNVKTGGDVPEGKGDFFKTLMVAILIALVIRTFFYEPFNIPSGSMLPTLEIGDYLFVSKMSYGYSKASLPLGIIQFDGRVFETAPEQGDVIVFKLPSNPKIDYIKRLVGLPGDKIQVIKGRLYINNALIPREMIGLKRVPKPEGGYENLTQYIETLPNGMRHYIYEESDFEPLDNTEEFVVPEGHYFFMGDNRDNSQDSRVQSLVGYVPNDNLVGRADILFFSIDDTASIGKPWSWFAAIRYDRLFDRIKSLGTESVPAS